MLRHLDKAFMPLGGLVYRVTYMSRPTTLMEHPSAPEAIALLQWQSRKLNRLYGITGALLVGRHWFVQTLEGEPVALFATLARINLDRRHMDLRLFEVTEAPTRLFGDWTMHVGTTALIDRDLVARCTDSYRRPEPGGTNLLHEALKQSVLAA